MKKFKEIEVPASGKNGWAGGAYTMAFVYSNKGNFVVKGFFEEVKNFLKKKKNEGWKYFANYTMFSTDFKLINTTTNLEFPTALNIKVIKEALNENKEFKQKFNLVEKKESRNHWFFYKDNVDIWKPRNLATRVDWRGRVNKPDRFTDYYGFKMDNKKYNVIVRTNDDYSDVLKVLSFKRLPTKWIPEFDNL